MILGGSAYGDVELGGVPGGSVIPAVDVNRVTEFTYTLEGQLETLTARNRVTGDQVTRWHYGTTLEESGVASNSLLRAKVYPDSDDTGPGLDGPDEAYDRVEYRYNRLGELIGQKDPNETEHVYEYDGLGRLRADRVVALGSGVDGAVRRITRSYDRAGRLSSIASWSSPVPTSGVAVNEVQMRYNGFGQLIEEFQSHDGLVATGSTPVVSYEYADGSDRHIRKLKTIYPGGRQIRCNYGEPGGDDDKLGRVYELQDYTELAGAVPQARYTRRGLSATVRIEYPQCNPFDPLELTYIKQGEEPDGPAGDQYTGLDQFNRIIDIRWLRPGSGDHVDRIQYGFDRASNRLWRKNVVAATDWDELYNYDGLYQLTQRQRGTLNSECTALTGTPLDDERFTFDPTGNWDRYRTDASGSSTLDQTREHNRANEINAIDGSGLRVGYDRAGNMTRMPKVGDWDAWQEPVWDAWNRMVGLMEGETVAGTYAYDGLTRRIWKESVEYAPYGTTRRHFFYSDQWQMLEERINGESVPDRTFLWGLRYKDDMVMREGATEPLYVTHDQWHVISIADPSANVVERYAYRAFGELQMLDGSFGPRTASDYGWEHYYGAYFFDHESKCYQVRFRYLHPSLGRWLSRDPIGEEGGLNILGYVLNSPIQAVDPLGLIAIKKCKGVCGANIDDWILEEVDIQIREWTAWLKANGKSTFRMDEFLRWTNGNQRYKDPAFFKFSDKIPSCATSDCSFSVTLCGTCVKSATLGNIIYGLLAAYQKIPLDVVIDYPNSVKKVIPGTSVDPYDAEAYKLGYWLFGKLRPTGVLPFCKEFKAYPSESSGALLVTSKSGGAEDVTSCDACPHKTTETRHGGKSPPRFTP